MKTIESATGRVIKDVNQPTPGGKAARRLLRKSSLVSGFRRRAAENVRLGINHSARPK